MSKYKIKEGFIEAIQYTGENVGEISELVGYQVPFYYDNINTVDTNFIIVNTIDGKSRVYPSNYVIKTNDENICVISPDAMSLFFELINDL